MVGRAGAGGGAEAGLAEGALQLAPHGLMQPEMPFDSAMSTAPSRWRIADTSKEVLEQEFRRERFPSATSRLKLAESLDVEPRRIQVWFQNRRQRDRGPSSDTPDMASTDSSSICSESSAPLPLRTVPVRSAQLPNAAAATAAAASNLASRPSWFQPLDAATSRRDEGYRLPFPAGAPEAVSALRSKQGNQSSDASSKRKRPPYDAYPVSAEGQDMEARQTIGSILSSSCDVVNALMGFESAKEARSGSDDVEKMSRESDKCSVDSGGLLSDSDTLWSFSPHEISKQASREMTGDTHSSYNAHYGTFTGTIPAACPAPPGAHGPGLTRTPPAQHVGVKRACPCRRRDLTLTFSPAPVLTQARGTVRGTGNASPTGWGTCTPRPLSTR
jgi:hypothetical protein